MYRFALLLLAAFAVSVQGLYRYGYDYGDSRVPTSDDGNSGELQLMCDYGFYGETYDSIWINVNGNLMFNGGSSAYWPPGVPNYGNPAIAPFWADVDLYEGGSLFYRETDDEWTMGFATASMQCAFPCLDFTPTKAFIVTWENVDHYMDYSYYDYYSYSYSYSYSYDSYYRKKRAISSYRNTFQCILLTDGSQTYVIYDFENIVWTYGDASKSEDALVGFNAGDGVRSWQHPDSYTYSIINVEETTNTGNLGQWIFRVDRPLLYHPEQICPTYDTCTCTTSYYSSVNTFDGSSYRRISAQQKTTLVEYNQGITDVCKFRLRVETKPKYSYYSNSYYSIKKVYFSFGNHPSNVDKHYKSIMISSGNVKERGWGLGEPTNITLPWWMVTGDNDLEVYEEGTVVKVRNTKCQWFLDVDRRYTEDLRVTFTTGYTGGVVDGFCGDCNGVYDGYTSYTTLTNTWRVD